LARSDHDRRTGREGLEHCPAARRRDHAAVSRQRARAEIARPARCAAGPRSPTSEDWHRVRS